MEVLFRLIILPRPIDLFWLLDKFRTARWKEIFLMNIIHALQVLHFQDVVITQFIFSLLVNVIINDINDAICQLEDLSRVYFRCKNWGVRVTDLDRPTVESWLPEQW